jgi:single-strand DNA-binding protein
MSFSKHIVLGNLGRDPELRYTPQGTPVASFPVCSNEKYAGQEKQNWYDVNVFGNSAEVVSEHLRTGDTVYVEGRLDCQIWTKTRGKDAGKQAISMKINTNNVQFVTKRRNGDGASAAPAQASAPGEAPPTDLTDDDVPF